MANQTDPGSAFHKARTAHLGTSIFCFARHDAVQDGRLIALLICEETLFCEGVSIESFHMHLSRNSHNSNPIQRYGVLACFRLFI